MARDLSQLSTTPANNDATGGFKTGMRPSSVKNAGWADESILAQLFNSKTTAGGTANAITLTNPVPFTSLTSGLTCVFWPSAANTGAATFAPDGLAQKSIFANGGSLGGGEMQSTVPAWLKYDGTQWNLFNPVPNSAADRNFFIDPCCRVAQIGTAGTIPTLTTSYKYGVVDLVQCKATGTAVSAGTITQDSSTTVSTGETPYSAKIAGATITGTGKVFFRRFIESRDSQTLNGQTVIFSVKCRQDTGGSINAFLTLNKFQSQDSAGTPTQLATNSASVTAVATGADTIVSISYTFGAADGANGIELILEMDCGAVTTKNFYATDWQARMGTAVRAFKVPDFTEELVKIQARYYEQTYNYGVASGTSTSSGAVNFWLGGAPGAGTQVGNWRFRGTKVVTPAASIFTDAGVSGSIHDTSGAGNKACTTTPDTDSFILIATGALASGDHYLFHYTVDARL